MKYMELVLFCKMNGIRVTKDEGRGLVNKKTLEARIADWRAQHPEPTDLQKVPELSKTLVDDGQKMITDARREQEVVQAALKAIDRIVTENRALEAAGVIATIPSDTIENLTVRMNRAGKAETEGIKMLDRGISLQTAYDHFVDLVAELGKHGISMPQWMIDLQKIVRIQRYRFTLAGDYRLEAEFDAESLDQAKKMLRDANPISRRWCKPGVDEFWKGVDQLSLDQPIESRVYNSTLTVSITDSTETPTFRRHHRYVFTLNGDTYEGRSIVWANSMEEAKRRLLNSDVDEGDKLSEAEFEADHKQHFLEAFARLSDTNRTVEMFGHTLRVTVR